MKKEFIFTHEPVSDEILKEIRDKIPTFIEGKRLNHTFFVEKEAITIAKAFFLMYNISDSYLNDISAAALLHDMTKQMDMNAQLALCEMHGIEPGENPTNAILHGKTAAHMAKKIFHINDTVFSAVYSHTTGKENMNLFDKIIFIADYTEESRTHESCVRVRELLHTSLASGENPREALDKAIVMSLDATLSFLISSGKDIDLQTVSARNFLLRNMPCGTVNV